MMTQRKRLWITFLLIMAISILAGLVSWPKGPDFRIGKFHKELKIHLGLDFKGGSQLVYETNIDQIPDSEKPDAADGVRDVVERRVNVFGVSEPVVQTNKAGGKWRVIVELPGITDTQQAIDMIGQTPILEFREQQSMEPQKSKEEIDQLNEEVKKRAESVLAEALKPAADFSKLVDEKTEDPSGKDQGGDLGYFAKEEMVPEFSDAAFKGEIGKVYPELVKSVFGYHILKVEDRKKEKNDKGEEIEKTRARHILIRTKGETESSLQYVNTGLSGKHLTKSQVQFDQTTGQPEISLQFNDEGSELFAEITKRNLEKPVAIYLDGSPISIPVVQAEITNGQAVITGSFTIDEAKTLVKRLNAGALPVPITLVSQQNIGPSLGKESVERSLFAGLLGLFAVSIFMAIHYRFPGFLAVFALLIYALIVLAIFKFWPVILTLSGVAGFILSIGMAVDANILIFERMNEELRGGKPFSSAIEDGFKRAWTSIRDSNTSSLITCFILGWFGTSLIKGFAITLAIGILVSMFSAITITRTFLRLTALKHKV